MNVIETIILGIIQALTEFLPVSSSGHLVIFQNILGFKDPELFLDCSLHLGTLFAVIIFFRNDIKKMIADLIRIATSAEGSRAKVSKLKDSMLLWVVVGSIPTGIIGLVFRTELENLFGSVIMVGWMLILTGIILALTRLIPRDANRKRLGLLIAFAVGIAQGLAIIPGISRSGSTIACGFLCGLEREQAGRFSFILSIPAIIGALAIQMDFNALNRVGIIPVFAGFITSAIVGFFALKLLMRMVKKGHLFYFAPYCWAVGLATILFQIL